MSYHKGSLSLTRPGRKDFTTKKGNKVFHQKGHYVRKTYRPYSKNFTKKRGTKRSYKKVRYFKNIA
jgi:hypothetical protein